MRTTSEKVKELLFRDFDDEDCPSLDPAVAAANALTDRVVSAATSKGESLTTKEAELVERYLAAHFYCQSDRQYSSSNTEGSSGSFAGQSGMYLESTSYGQTAMLLDTSGSLRELNGPKRAVASGISLHKTESAQRSYRERN